MEAAMDAGKKLYVLRQHPEALGRDPDRCFFYEEKGIYYFGFLNEAKIFEGAENDLDADLACRMMGCYHRLELSLGEPVGELNEVPEDKRKPPMQVSRAWKYTVEEERW